MTYDCIVAGLGPGGAITAWHLARAGWKVLALDQDRFPRHKPCGGGLTVKTIKALPFGVEHLYEDTTFGGIFSFRLKNEIRLDCTEPYAYMVDRDGFDHYLVEQARSAGVLIREGEAVTGVKRLPEGILVSTGQGEYQGRYLVGADGAHSVVAKFLHPGIRRRNIIALERDFAVNPSAWEHLRGRTLIDIATIPLGYSWIFPKRDRLSVGSAGLKESGRSIKRHFARFIAHQPFLSGQGGDGARGHVLPLPYQDRVPLYGNGVLLVGDAGGLVNPFSGEGIYFAVESGNLASRALCRLAAGEAGDLSEYDHMIKEAFYFEFKWAYRLMRLVTMFPGLTFRIISDHLAVMPAYFDLLRGTRTYQNVYQRLMVKIRQYMTQPINPRI